MSHDEKINYMRIAAGIAHFGFSNEQLDLLVSIYDMILKKEGKGSIEDVVRIEFEVKERTIKNAISEKVNKPCD
jgi:hypothetical protein